MDKTGKFLLPSPKFKQLEKPSTQAPHFLSPQGMLLPKDQQPPPMYGPRGATLPPKFLGPQRSPTPSTSNQFDKYFCEPCEAEFHTSTDYKVHRSEHTQCEIDNCTFRGHPSFMDTHIGQQHATGVYDQLKKLSTPEEIAQWRADRKKNYPTVAIVAQKHRAREQRMLRGEKLEGNKNRFGRHSDRRPIRGDKQKEMSENADKPAPNKRQRKKNRSGKQGARKDDKRREVAVQTSSEKEVDEEPTSGGLKMFKGTGTMPGYKKLKKVETHALSSLLGMYGSDSDDEEEKFEPSEEMPEDKEVAPEEPPRDEVAPEEPPRDEVAPEEPPRDEVAEPHTTDDQIIEEVQETQNQEPLTTSIEKNEANAPPSVPNEPHSSDDDAPVEAAIEKTSNIPDRPQSEPPRKKVKHEPPKKKAPRSGLDYRKLRGGRQNTMLEKLLEPDIRHERNILLQCVRFVVENKFFGIGSSSQSQS